MEGAREGRPPVGLGEGDTGMKTAPNFPATDHPGAGWYGAFGDKHGAV